MKNLSLFLLPALLCSLFSCEKDDTGVPEHYVNDWIYENMSIYYLWNNKIPKNPNYTLQPKDFFSSLLNTYHPVTNPEGDRNSWIQEDYTELLNSLNGISSDEIGFEYTFVKANPSGSQYYALVLYPRHGTDAEAKGIKRGRFITQIDGKDITPSNYNTLFSGSGTKRLSMADWVFNPDKQLELKKSGDITISMHNNFADNPVYSDSIYIDRDKKIGYLVYHFFSRDKGDNSYTYDKQLISKLSYFQSEGINEMVLDLRYNSGGAVTSAIALASALVKNRSTSNVLVTSQYNSIIHNELRKEDGDDYNKEYFVDKIPNTSVSIPSFDKLQRLHVLTSGWTASASEFVINGLKPYMDVVLVGDTTYGKNVGSISIYEKNDPKNKWGMQPIVVKYLNSAGESDFTAGFAPDHVVDEFENLYLYDFGDTEDPLLGKALSLITGHILSTTISTPFRSSQVAGKASVDMRDRSRFEMYDDLHDDAIRNLRKK